MKFEDLKVGMVLGRKISGAKLLVTYKEGSGEVALVASTGWAFSEKSSTWDSISAHRYFLIGEDCDIIQKLKKLGENE